MTYRIHRVYQNDRIIIYKRLFDLTSDSDKRYFEVDKETMEGTGKQFVSKTQIKKYIKQYETINI